METINDALGNPIIIGNRYGYTDLHNGIVKVATGIATEIKEQTVTLTEVQTVKGVFGVIKDSFEPSKQNRHVYGCKLFPIN